MLELPPEGSVDLGLGPRSFRARGAPEKGADRSMWTDTPADKARKEEEAKRRVSISLIQAYCVLGLISSTLSIILLFSLLQVRVRHLFNRRN